MKIYKDRDASQTHLKNDKILVIGFGNQGRAFVLNLKDSGFAVTVCVKAGSKYRNELKKRGIKYITPSKIDDTFSIIILLLPDNLHSDFFKKYMDGKIRRDALLVFAHGYSIHFKQIKNISSHDIVLIAPHGPGKDLREKYLQGKGISSFFAVDQDISGKASKKGLALAKAIGCTRAGVFLTSFEEETLGDLFGEQALLCGGLSELIQLSYDTLIRKGIPAENAYLETVHQIDLLANLIKEYGISGMMKRVSEAAQFGMVKTHNALFDKNIKSRLNNIFDEIKSGQFTKDWKREEKTGYRKLERFRKKLQDSKLEKSSNKIRKVIKK